MALVMLGRCASVPFINRVLITCWWQSAFYFMHFLWSSHGCKGNCIIAECSMDVMVCRDSRYYIRGPLQIQGKHCLWQQPAQGMKKNQLSTPHRIVANNFWLSLLPKCCVVLMCVWSDKLKVAELLVFFLELLKNFIIHHVNFASDWFACNEMFPLNHHNVFVAPVLLLGELFCLFCGHHPLCTENFDV